MLHNHRVETVVALAVSGTGLLMLAVVVWQLVHPTYVTLLHLLGN